MRGEWIDAPPIEGTYVIGAMMTRWGNDRYKSMPHRMVSPLGVHRYSMPFFAEPNPETIISSLPGCQGPDNPVRYPDTTCSAYMLSRFAETYAYRREASPP